MTRPPMSREWQRPPPGCRSWGRSSRHCSSCTARCPARRRCTRHSCTCRLTRTWSQRSPDRKCTHPNRCCRPGRHHWHRRTAHHSHGHSTKAGTRRRQAACTCRTCSCTCCRVQYCNLRRSSPEHRCKRCRCWQSCTCSCRCGRSGRTLLSRKPSQKRQGQGCHGGQCSGRCWAPHTNRGHSRRHSQTRCAGHHRSRCRRRG